MKISRTIKIFILGLFLAAIFFISFPFIFYLKILPNIIANPNFIKYTHDFIKQKTGTQLTLKNPQLKTSFSPIIEINATEISLSKDEKYILSIKNLHNQTSLRHIFKHKINLISLGANEIFVNVNKLQSILPKQKQKKNDWVI